MKKIAIGLAIAIVCAGLSGHGEGSPCPGGVCPLPVRQVSDTPAKAQYPALVAVHFRQTGTTDIVSGAIVHVSGDTAEVLTCAHGYTKGCRPLVITQDGKRYQARLKGIDVQQDVALLGIRNPGLKPLPLAEAEPAANARVYVCGYASGRFWRGQWSHVVQWVGPARGQQTWLEVGCAAEGGMSGGPILDAHGRIVGLITGTDGPRCVGPCLPRIRKLIKFLLPPYRPIVKKVVRPIVQVPSNKAELQALRDEIKGLKAEIAALRAEVKQVAKQPGPAGKDGAVGPQGPPGKDGAPCDYEALVKRLPPIRIQTLNQDGTVHQDAEARLGDLVRLLPLIVKPEGE